MTKRKADRFLAPVISPVHRVTRNAWLYMKKKWSRDVVLMDTAGAVTVSGASGELTITRPPLDESATLGELISALNKRLARIDIDTDSIRIQLADERNVRATTDARLEVELNAIIQTQAEDERKLTLRGLRIQAVGLTLLTIGALVQTYGSLTQ